MSEKNLKTIEELCEKMWHLENEYKLLKFEIHGIFIWQLIRFKIFNKLALENGLYSQAHSNKILLIDRIKKAPRLLLNSIKRNPMSFSYERDFFIYDHPRKVTVNGRNIDIYTQFFIENQNNNSFDIIESPYIGDHITSVLTSNRKYRDHEILTTLVKKVFSTIKLNNNEDKKIKKLEEMLDTKFNLNNIDIYSFVIKEIKKFIYQYNYHKRLFKKRNPKCIYIVVSYGFIPIISAAKDLGIKVIEFQHGVITDYHFGYNFGNPSEYIDYFPDKILTFGDYWAHTKGFPEQTEIEVYGFPYLEEQLKKYKHVPKKKKQILVLSQGTIGKGLSNQIKKVAKKMPDYNFIYKLHPGEYDRWRNEYPNLVEANNFKNLEVVDSNETSLYEYFAESEFQIGVNSTAIFEGMTLGCKTVLLNLQGIEYMNDLIKSKIVMLANDSESCVNAIHNFKSKEFNKDYFFKNREDM